MNRDRRATTWRGYPSERAFYGVSALVFVTSAAVTIAGCISMSSMREMEMPGGWTMSMAWMRMPGQTWIGAVTSFLSMWTMMMVAMMLPSLVAMLRDYRQSLTGRGTNVGWLTALAAVGYYSVWTVIGVVAFPIVCVLAAVAMQQPAAARAVPTLIGVIVLIAGVIQLSPLKMRALASCRGAHDRVRRVPVGAATALGHGVGLGLRCARCCGNLMALLLVIGLMDLWAMAALTAAITAERIAGKRVARAIGVVLCGLGCYLIARATVPG